MLEMSIETNSSLHVGCRETKVMYVDNLVILASLLVKLLVPDGSTIRVAVGREFPVYSLIKFFLLSLGVL
jgi:hypothetical protein